MAPLILSWSLPSPISAGDYGVSIAVTCLPAGGNFVDGDGLASVKLILVDPITNTPVEKAMTVASNGGSAEYALADGDIPDTDNGTWELSVVATYTTTPGQLQSDTQLMYVAPSFLSELA